VSQNVRKVSFYSSNRRLRFSSDADIVRLTNARIIIIIIKPALAIFVILAENAVLHSSLVGWQMTCQVFSATASVLTITSKVVKDIKYDTQH